MKRVVVVGGGIAGLTAALQLSRSAEVIVLDSSPRFGGKLLGAELAGHRVDVGAEAYLQRRPAMEELLTELGLLEGAGESALSGVHVWQHDKLHKLGFAALMGVPRNPREIASLLSPLQFLRAGLDVILPRTKVEPDISVGEYVSRRFGPGVVNAVVEPLLGGVYAGDPNGISMRLAIPQLWQEAAKYRSGLAAAQAVKIPKSSGSPFGCPNGGLHVITETLVAMLTIRGVTLLPATQATKISESYGGWLVETTKETLPADAVVIAAPAFASAKILSELAPTVAAELSEIKYSSMAIASFALSSADVLPTQFVGNGFLVAQPSEMFVKAATWSTNKWPYLAENDPEHFHLRASIGRIGGQDWQDLSDDELLDRAWADVVKVTKTTALPVGKALTRWPNALPQLAPGHLALISRVRESLPAGISVCGAWVDGVGIPVVVASAKRAAMEVLDE